MPNRARMRDLGPFAARVPRYTSYPPANRFTADVGPAQTAAWLEAVPAGARVALYVHVPYCRQLCWFCACRTQGTLTDRPLGPYLARLRAELALLDRHLRPDLRIAAIHLGGGTPTILPAPMLEELTGALRSFRPLAPDLSFSAEIDPTEFDVPRLDALVSAGLTRAVLGVQDFDPAVQQAIGRSQPYELTRYVASMLRAAGVGSLQVEQLFGLPLQTRARLAETVRKLLTLAPDRVALHDYAHVPWLATRQSLIPTDALPASEERLDQFEVAARLLRWAGYRSVGIDHFARPDDPLVLAADRGGMRRVFTGYTDDGCDLLLGIGASAISRFPQGFSQNASTSSAYAEAVGRGRLATERGHVLTPDDRLRADMIERLLCRLELDLRDLSRAHGVSLTRLLRITAPLRHRFADRLEAKGETLRLVRAAPPLARLAARELDASAGADARQGRAV